MKTKLLLLAGATILNLTSQAADCCSKGAQPSCCNQPATVAGPLSDKSIYQLEGAWTNDAGHSVALNALKGRPQVVAMFFARCQYACPLLVYKMKQIEAALPEDLRSKTDFLLVSFDSDRDTPAELAKYRVQHELGSHWSLLRGNASDVQDLAAVLGIKYKQDAEGMFMHSNVLTLLNPGGEIAYQEPGLGSATAEMVGRITTLVKP